MRACVDAACQARHNHQSGKPRSRDSMSANLRASALALRAPTMAIISFWSRCGWPRTLISAAHSPAPPGRAGILLRRMRSGVRPILSVDRSRDRLHRHPAERRSCRPPRPLPPRLARRGNSASAAGSRTETRQQAAKGDGPHLLGARQAQPVPAFWCAELHYVFAPMRGSSPRSRRRILSRCMVVIRADSKSARAA
jgi:hypothetical protein